MAPASTLCAGVERAVDADFARGRVTFRDAARAVVPALLGFLRLCGALSTVAPFALLPVVMVWLWHGLVFTTRLPRRCYNLPVILLVRHGETDGNRERVMQRPEVPLNAAGLAQAERVAQRLARSDITHVLSSDLARARMTAEAIARAAGVPLELSPLLQERNFGALRGTAYADLGVDPFAPDYLPPDGESVPAFHARVAQAFAWMLARRRAVSGTLVVVSHGLLCYALAERHLACDGHTLPARFDNTSVSAFELDAPHRVHRLNCCAHLAQSGTSSAEGPV